MAKTDKTNGEARVAQRRLSTVGAIALSLLLVVAVTGGLAALASLWSSPVSANGAAGPTPRVTLPGQRLVPGTQTKLSIEAFPDGWEHTVQGVVLHAADDHALSLAYSMTEKNYGDRVTGIDVSFDVPPYSVLAGQLGLPGPRETAYWKRFFGTHTIDLEIVFQHGTPGPRFSMEVQNPTVAATWGLVAVFLVVLFLGAIDLRHRDPKTRQSAFGTVKAALSFPVRLVRNDTTKRYSLTYVQTALWTGVTVYGLVFVWKMREQFLDITPQVLLLLGIGGATAVVSTHQSNTRVRELEKAEKQLGTTEPRTPQLRDLITTGNRISLAKIQMLVFTVLIAGHVAKAITEHHAFPLLSSGLVILIGLSSGVYLGDGHIRGMATKETAKELVEETAADTIEPADEPPADPVELEHEGGHEGEGEDEGEDEGDEEAGGEDEAPLAPARPRRKRAPEKPRRARAARIPVRVANKPAPAPRTKLFEQKLQSLRDEAL